MASRGSALSRAIRYFKEAEYEEAMVAQVRVVEIMAQRTKFLADVKKSAKPIQRRKRKPSPDTSSVSSIAELDAKLASA